LRKSIEDDAKNVALREKSLVEEINSLKSQLAAKEKEKIETIEALHNMESRCISVGAKLKSKTEEYDNLKKDIEKIVREKNYLEKKSLEKDQNFHNKCNHLWELCKIAMINLVRSQKILVGRLENSIRSLLGFVDNMKICLLFYRLLLI
jgi:chromosome segregation ATPase